jgi:hypothetical protein
MLPYLLLLAGVSNGAATYVDTSIPGNSAAFRHCERDSSLLMATTKFSIGTGYTLIGRILHNGGTCDTATMAYEEETLLSVSPLYALLSIYCILIRS